MYSSLIGETSSLKKTFSARPSGSSETTSAVVTPLAQCGYDGKSAMTSITWVGKASMTIDDVVCSAI